MKELISDILIPVNLLILDMRHVFLVEDVLDSMKFGLFLWLLAYIGSLVNAITIIIIAWTGLFTIPKVYLNNRYAIDPLIEKHLRRWTVIIDIINIFSTHTTKKCNKDE